MSLSIAAIVEACAAGLTALAGSADSHVSASTRSMRPSVSPKAGSVVPSTRARTCAAPCCQRAR